MKILAALSGIFLVMTGFVFLANGGALIILTGGILMASTCFAK